MVRRDAGGVVTLTIDRPEERRRRARSVMFAILAVPTQFIPNSQERPSEPKRRELWERELDIR